jgi:hypothetical protein
MSQRSHLGIVLVCLLVVVRYVLLLYALCDARLGLWVERIRIPEVCLSL